MSDLELTTGPTTAQTRAKVQASIKRRYRAEMRFRAYGLFATMLGVLFVFLLFFSVFSKGWSIFGQHYVKLDVFYDAAVLDPSGTRNPDTLRSADYQALVRASLRAGFPTVEGRRELRELTGLVSSGASMQLQRAVMQNPTLIGTRDDQWVLASSQVDWLLKGRTTRNASEDERRLSDAQVTWLDALQADQCIERRFNKQFFTAGDSRDPELAGVGGALAGSLLTLLVTLLLSFPIGAAAAIYLEEFAPPETRVTDLIEVNINNLAAVPSIVFGLLGLSIFIGFFGMPRSATLVGGLVLTLLTLPTIIIASRAAIKAVPPSIREAALGMGASKIQCVVHHVLPLAMPGMLTGAIIGMARALGETAPLLMIGMVAFIVDVPQGIMDPATVLPVQVFLWADSPERGFIERTSGAIIVLLLFLVIMNASAVILRNRFEKRW
ncbi:MAG: phosphate ABC transporter permease PstA [Gammaproteobacteria bacterium]|nr:phosphate ABC transporter permease PstA [Gammaproteobacteria bacterium]